MLKDKLVRFEAELFGTSRFSLERTLIPFASCDETEKNIVRKEILNYLDFLSYDPSLNALRVGYLMTLLDTRHLCEDLRLRLGFDKQFTPINMFSEPIIRSIWNVQAKDVGNVFSDNCGSSETHLKNRHDRIEFADFYKNPARMTQPIVMYDSLIVEIAEMNTGFATQTVEFANGVSLIAGCWYVIKSNKVREELKGHLLNRRANREDVEYHTVSGSKESGVKILEACPVHCELSISRTLHGPGLVLDNLHY